jgi:hypothetical protein
MERTLPMTLQWDESFDIASDTLTGVNDADYRPPFALTAKLNKLNPWEWLKDVLLRVSSDRTVSALGLLPHKWRKPVA